MKRKQSPVLFHEFMCSPICIHDLLPYADNSLQHRPASVCTVPNTARSSHRSGTGKYPGTALSSSCSPLLMHMFVLIFPLSDFEGAAFNPTNAVAAS